MSLFHSALGCGLSFQLIPPQPCLLGVIASRHPPPTSCFSTHSHLNNGAHLGEIESLTVCLSQRNPRNQGSLISSFGFPDSRNPGDGAESLGGFQVSLLGDVLDPSQSASRFPGTVAGVQMFGERTRNQFCLLTSRAYAGEGSSVFVHPHPQIYFITGFTPPGAMALLLFLVFSLGAFTVVVNRSQKRDGRRGKNFSQI